MVKKVIIMGAAGRDFHNFNILFRNNKNYKVICFTAEQIPGISERSYPKELSGKFYPKGVPIYPEQQLPKLIKKHKIDEVILSYSDLSNQEVMEKASLINAAGADFKLASADSTMLKSKRKIISVCAVRTGCGKSQTTRKISSLLRKRGKKLVVVRHPMPYGDLRKQEVQRFATLKDLDEHNCTIEEREEYEQHINNGTIVYAGVDYGKILKKAEKEAEIILWDGGNNDPPFFKPDLHIVVTDALRPNHELTYYPGHTNFLLADVIVINKENSAPKKNIQTIVKNIKKFNPKAQIIHADSILSAPNPKRLKGKKTLVIEDGPTLTHGGMKFGAGFKFAQKHEAKLINVKKYAVGSLKKTYEKYPHLEKILPAMGYSKKQLKELESTIKKSNPEIILTGTPIDLNLLFKFSVPIIHVKYALKEKNLQLEKLLKQNRFI